jgi:hypothetical protein
LRKDGCSSQGDRQGGGRHDHSVSVFMGSSVPLRTTNSVPFNASRHLRGLKDE